MNDIKVDKILLVEDEAVIAEAEKVILKKCGYNVVVARSGAEAIEIADTARNISLVLMDINLGKGISGIEAAKKIIKKHELPLIFMTTHSERDVIKMTEGIPSYGYIIKNPDETITAASIKRTFKAIEADKIEKEKRMLLRKNRALSVLTESYRKLLHGGNENILLDTICRIIVKTGGYTLSWIGLSLKYGDKRVYPAAQAGIETAYLKTLNLTWAMTESAHRPTFEAIRTGKPVTERYTESDHNFDPWRMALLESKIGSSVSLPLKNGETILGVLNIYSSEHCAFGMEEVELLTQLANDLSYEITTIRTKGMGQNSGKKDPIRHSGRPNSYYTTLGHF